jgi:hypothetical protein
MKNRNCADNDYLNSTKWFLQDHMNHMAFENKHLPSYYKDNVDNAYLEIKGNYNKTKQNKTSCKLIT